MSSENEPGKLLTGASLSASIQQTLTCERRKSICMHFSLAPDVHLAALFAFFLCGNRIDYACSFVLPMSLQLLVKSEKRELR